MEAAPERSLREDLRRMMENVKFTDMVFLCGDAAEEVPASRMLVATRSPVLEAMLLKVGTSELTKTRITLPEIDAHTMRICLEFFYTDTIKHSPHSPQNETFVKVLAAARFLLITKLEHIALSYLRSYVNNFYFVRTSTSLLVDTAKAYTRAVDLLRSRPHDIHLHKVLVHIANCVELFTGWRFEGHKHLSRQALAHLVQNVSAPVSWVGETTLGEYFQFVKVVEWCASQLVLHADDPITEEKYFGYAIDQFLPQSTHINWRLSNAADKPLDVQSLRVFELLREPLAECLEHVPVKLYKIPPLILSRNIEPLGILPSSAFFSAYRAQALSRVHLRWDEFEHHKYYKLWTEGTETSCTSDVFAGFARCSTGIEHDNIGEFEWEVVILEACNQLRVGFYFGGDFMRSGDESNHDTVLGDWYGSWALSSDGLLYHDHMREPEAYCDAFPVKIGLSVGVHLTCNTFSFSVNGGKGAEIELPSFPCDERLDAPIYPAISMRKPGRARIQMVVQDWMAHPLRKELLDPNGVKEGASITL